VIVDNWAPQETTLTCGLIDDIGDPSLVLEDPRRLSELLRKCDGRVADVATVLGVSRGHVYRVLKQLGIRPKAGRLDS
jgi:transcriptional regulator of acetoin/glycerol metabolism